MVLELFSNFHPKSSQFDPDPRLGYGSLSPAKRTLKGRAAKFLPNLVVLWTLASVQAN
jgi:hypothetical protein